MAGVFLFYLASDFITVTCNQEKKHVGTIRYQNTFQVCRAHARARTCWHVRMCTNAHIPGTCTGTNNRYQVNFSTPAGSIQAVSYTSA